MKPDPFARWLSQTITNNPAGPASDMETGTCAICARLFPAATLVCQGGAGDICPDCLAELENCGCADESYMQ